MARKLIDNVEVADILEKEGIVDLSDLANIDDEDIFATFPMFEHRQVAIVARDEAKNAKCWMGQTFS